MSSRRRERRGLIRVVLILALTSVVIAQPGQTIAPLPSALASALDGIRAERLMAHVTTLASDAFEGRGPGTPGETRTVNYLVEQFKRAGLQPGNPDGTYIQRVPLVGYTSVPEIQIEAGGRKTSLTFLDDFVHDYPALRPLASAKSAGIVFAGYGIEAPEYGWNDYAGVDVRQKLVLVLSGEPSRPGTADPKTPDPAFFKGDTLTYYSTRDAKFDLAEKKGAAGILVVYDPASARTYSLFQTFAKMEGFGLASTRDTATVISGLMTIGAARRVATLAGRDFDQLAAGATQPRARAVVLNATADISVKSTIRNVVSRNVVARVEGSDRRLKDEYVIYSAHWDHLGTDPTLAGDQIYNGAIDNAAGTAQLLEIARGVASLRRKPKRSILFIAVTAEEKGFLGSRFYAQHPLFPISKTIANINLDGGNVWGPTSDLIATGYGLSTLDEALGAAARVQGRTFLNEGLDNGSLYFASDQIEFAKAGIPAAFPFSGSTYVGKPKEFAAARWKAYSEKDYHKVTDEVQTDWNLSGAAEDARWLLIAGYNVADANTRPEWKPGSEFKRVATGVPQSTAERPNVVLIMTDDAGYADTGSYGAPDIRTPNIDSLARAGVRLTDFYANAMSCTPTRAGLIAGRYQQRYGVEFVIPAPGLPGSEGGLPPLAHSLPLLMKNNGYATALVGKWHLGYKPEFSPRAHGFGSFFGYKSAAIDYYTHFTTRPSEGAQFVSAQPDLWEDDALIEQDGYMTDLIARRTVEFINQNAARPFFIDVAFNAPHSPTQRPDQPGRPQVPGAATRADYVAVMERVDRGVGEILQALRTRGLEKNTIVIFTNDNGGVGLSHSGPLFHRKFSAWEGGIRVPALIRWPGRIPAGTVSAQVGVTMDLTASILAATATPVPSEARLEGINLLPTLQRKAPLVERTLFWRTAGPSPVNMNQKAVRSGDWKLLIDGAVTRIFLFNVKADTGERHDLFARRPEIVQRLQTLLADWERDVDAEAKAFAARRQ